MRILIKLVLIFVLAFAAVKTMYIRVEKQLRRDSAPQAAIAAPKRQPEEKTKILRKPDDYTIIVQRNIFQAVAVQNGTESEVKTEPVVAPKPSPPLKLSLMGTIGGDERVARAIISDDTKRQQDIYQVGDSIQDAMIVSISRGKVVLSVNGKEEVLSLKDRQGGGAAYAPSPADFYQESPEQVVPPQADFPPDSGMIPPDMEMPPDMMEPPDLGTGVQDPAMTGEQPGRRRPTVRPRPVRRTPASSVAGSGTHP